MKKCQNCGTENPNESKFCSSCGTKLETPKPLQFNDNVIAGDVDLSTHNNIVNNYNSTTNVYQNVETRSFKCKMCGEPLEVDARKTVVRCNCCESIQTVPKLDDDKRANMYDRANHFRRNNEFDKAMGIYEQILNEDNTDAEAYWSLVLCRYGIEYVEDPSTKKRIPTVNRAQYTSILADEDYKSALANADTYQKSIYELEAKAIDEIQKGILAISQKEEPFDVFICYKETDNSGRRTPDSVLAQELYFALKNEGFKVFFARITLEDKLGSAYEPYIFAALNSSKVMVVLGTKPEFFSAVWVKNEWSRYLALIKQGQKKMLIPAYKDMDPYELPEEFSYLQAQDMSKLGFMQDLIRGIKKIVNTDEPKQSPVVKETVVKESVATGGNSNIAPLLKRAFMFLEDGDWNNANEYCEKVLDMDPENAQAYLGKLMAECRVRKQEGLKDCAEPFDNRNNYQKAIRFANATLRAELKGYIEHIKTRNENARLEGIYTQAMNAMKSAKTEQDFKEARKLFASIDTYKDSASLRDVCYEKAEIARKDAAYDAAKKNMARNNIAGYRDAIGGFASIPGWKDADELRERCRKERDALEQREKERQAEMQRQNELKRQQQERQAEEERQEELRKAKARRVWKIIYWIFIIGAIAANIYLLHNAIKVPFYNSLEGREIFSGWWGALWPSWIACAVTLIATGIIGGKIFEGYGFITPMCIEVIAMLVYVIVLGCIFPPNDSIFENIIGNIILFAFGYIVPVGAGAVIGYKKGESM